LETTHWPWYAPTVTRLDPSISMCLAVLAAACSAPSSPTPAHVAEGAPSGALVDVQPLTISFRGQTIGRLFADGRSESAGSNAPGSVLVPGPTIRSDGTIVPTRAGFTARLDASGAVYVVDARGASPREELFGHIVGDRFTFAGSERDWTVRVEDDVLWFGEHDSSQIDGVVTPSLRRTALVMAVAFYIEGALAER
jgi:hypothetical protein